MNQRLTLRPATNQDVPGVIQLIDQVYGEYGDRVNLDDADRDLLDLEFAYAARGGACVVLADESGILGCHAALPLDRERRLGTFRRLYLDPSLRGQEWGDTLMRWAIDWARQAQWQRVEFWSDTRFERAHRFFERFGFRRDGRLRQMSDGHEPYEEFGYALELSSALPAHHGVDPDRGKG